MPQSTKKQIRQSAIAVTKQNEDQIGSLVDDFINQTLNEINDPAWAFRNEYSHMWSWLKRQTTFATVSGTEDYVMERDVDRILLLRQTTSPAYIENIPDQIFFKLKPNPTESGNPKYFRERTVEGVSTRLSSADTIKVVSSSASDGSTFKVTVWGYISGRMESEVFTLNGTTSVTGTKTFDARQIFVSKSGVTTGNITVTRASTAATLVVLGPEETAPMFKMITLYPKPSSAITISVEYYKAIRELVNDSDVPEFKSKWHYVVKMGTIAKIQQYLGKTDDFLSSQALYEKAVRAMVSSDLTQPSLVTYLKRRENRFLIEVKRSDAQSL